MNAALTASMTTLPRQLRRTLIWDRGKELSGHGDALLRQYFPRATDLSRWSAEDLEAVAHAPHNRPREILGWQTPAKHGVQFGVRLHDPCQDELLDHLVLRGLVEPHRLVGRGQRTSPTGYPSAWR